MATRTAADTEFQADGPQTAFITGGNGNLGRRVAERLLARGQRVVRFDIPGTEPAAGAADETVLTGDIRDLERLRSQLRDEKPDTIYHLASLLSGSSETDLEQAWAINATASFNLMNLAREIGVDKFFFASTAATYAQVDQNPMPLDYPQWPESLYGATKVAVERLGAYFKTRHGLDFRCLRFPLVISPDAPKTAVSAFPSHALRAAVNGERFSFPVSANTGVSTLFIEDVIDSIVDFTAAERSGLTRQAYNLHGYYLSAEMVADAAKARFADFEYDFAPVESVERLIAGWPDVADDSDARRDWGWQPKYDFERSMTRVIELLSRERE